jgi:hypothetical protein
MNLKEFEILRFQLALDYGTLNCNMPCLSIV